MTRFLEDLREQPEALEAALTMPIADLARLAAECDRFVLTGMGASLAACYPAYLRLLAAGLPVTLTESGELVHYGGAWGSARTLLLVASQSGRSAEVQAALDAVGGARVVGVTNDPASPLAVRADETLLVGAGSERTGVSTKTYTAMVAVMQRAAALLTGAADPAPSLRGAVPALERYLAACERHVEWWSGAVGVPRHLFVLGRGPSLAAAADGALTIKEAARVAAEGMSVAQFRHGPIELAGPDLTCVVLEGVASTANLNASFAAELRDRGAQVAWCGGSRDGMAGAPVVDVDDRALPLVEHVPLQLLALHLAEQTGTDPGIFRHATKVTAVQ